MRSHIAKRASGGRSTPSWSRTNTRPPTCPRGRRLTSRDVLILLASAERRGAELEGLALAEQLTAHGVPATVAALAARSGDLAVSVLGRRPLDVATLRALRRRAGNASVVIAYGSSTLPASAIGLAGTGIPFIYRSIGDPKAWVRSRVHRARTGVLMRRAAHVVALWPGAAQQIERLYHIDPCSIAVVPNARDHLTFAPPSTAERIAARSRLGIDHDTTAVALVGSLTPEKRVGLAADAIMRVPSGQLLVAGDGPGSEVLASRAPHSGGRIRLLGRLSDVRPVLHAADLIVSTSASEGMPGAVIEAALCGVPAVATDVGAVSDVVGSGGILVPVTAGADAIASAITAAAKSAETLRRETRARAMDRFCWDAVLPHWLQLLRRFS